MKLLLLRAAGREIKDTILGNSDVSGIMALQLPQNIMSVCGALAGIVMLTSYREEVIAGPIIALGLISSAAMMAAGLACWNWDLFRLGIG